MSSRGWVRFEKFRLPLSYKVKCRLSKIVSRGRIKASYSHSSDSVVIRVEFDGSKVDSVTKELSGLIEEWARQQAKAGLQ